MVVPVLLGGRFESSFSVSFLYNSPLKLCDNDGCVAIESVRGPEEERRRLPLCGTPKIRRTWTAARSPSDPSRCP